MNSGYVGYSRSIRSQAAIEDYELPLSLINKSVIESFLNEHKEDYSENELLFLQKLAVIKWKFIAKEYARRSSWHHTGSHFNKTDHYDLLTVASKAIDLMKDIDHLYKDSQNVKSEHTFGVAKVQIWGGSRKFPKLVGHEVVAGVVIGNWLHYKEDHEKQATTSRYKTNANKTVMFHEFDSYDELVKEFKEFKNTKRVFNHLVKEKVK